MKKVSHVIHGIGQCFSDLGSMHSLHREYQEYDNKSAIFQSSAISSFHITSLPKTNMERTILKDEDGRGYEESLRIDIERDSAKSIATSSNAENVSILFHFIYKPSSRMLPAEPSWQFFQHTWLKHINWRHIWWRA